MRQVLWSRSCCLSLVRLASPLTAEIYEIENFNGRRKDLILSHYTTNA